ncbi:MAG TPA: hypothetical protein VNR60_05380 [Croceibacterium sp.]|nr:hypothetical protein [Croceibacterium sp.]
MRHLWSLGAGAVVAAVLGFRASNAIEIAALGTVVFMLLAGLLVFVAKLAGWQATLPVISAMALFLTIAIPMAMGYLLMLDRECADPCVITVTIAPQS